MKNLDDIEKCLKMAVHAPPQHKNTDAFYLGQKVFKVALGLVLILSRSACCIYPDRSMRHTKQTLDFITADHFSFIFSQHLEMISGVTGFLFEFQSTPISWHVVGTLAYFSLFFSLFNRKTWIVKSFIIRVFYKQQHWKGSERVQSGAQLVLQTFPGWRGAGGAWPLCSGRFEASSVDLTRCDRPMWRLSEPLSSGSLTVFDALDVAGSVQWILPLILKSESASKTRTVLLNDD